MDRSINFIARSYRQLQDIDFRQLAAKATRKLTIRSFPALGLNKLQHRIRQQTPAKQL